VCVVISALSALYNEKHIIHIRSVNGNAAAMDADCNVSKLPLNNNTIDIKARTMPQITLIALEGFNFPSEQKIPKTKVAESAEVIKNVTISSKETRLSIKPAG
jgi:hypothetical protein